MFFKECASGLGSTDCERAENKSVQLAEKTGVADLREFVEVARGSKRAVQFTNEISTDESTCQ